MSRKKELLSLSKRELVKRFSNLEEELQEIKNYLKAFDNDHAPSSKQLKKNTKKKESELEEDSSNEENKKKPRFPDKPKESNDGGIKLPEPDKIEELKLDVSPISVLPLGKPIGYHVKTIVDFPDKPIQTIEHRFMQYKNPLTGEIVEDPIYQRVSMAKIYKALQSCLRI